MVYRSQAVAIDDKHIEIIVAQMLRRVRVCHPGDTELLPGIVIDKSAFVAVNRRLKQRPTGVAPQPATCTGELLGITQAAQSDSFLAAAAIQEPARVLAEAALAGKVDRLVGLKENVILGRLVPAGTGFLTRRQAERSADDG